MKRLWQPMIVIALIAGAGGGVAKETATRPPDVSGTLGKPIQLFNGTNLDGWVWYQRPQKPGAADVPRATIADVWSVKNGILHTTGKPTGYIRTETVYDNYILTVEQRHPVKGN